MAELTAPDGARINWNLTYKFQPKQYESMTIGASVSDTARPGESTQEAMDRIYADLEEQFGEKFEAAKKAMGV